MSAQELSAPAKQSLAYSYAALLLTDIEADITADRLESILKASNVATSAALSKVFARALEGKDVKEFFAGGAGGDAPVQAQAQGQAPAAAQEEAKPEEPEEDMDMGGLFD
ncbi:hypothetical protein PPERSA_01530 [Pseudocohnilembus persalinus]|uniref:Ribosomal protein 60S n=1 Tax=Pseudocohnilembus persalinus TaxID=266149 RepID=A0A0V0R7S0_PSEPJ|nr:hypothetical protein PPERSA_01530 [Pseudocohnilembus persalinus]|eukprot:KRX10518.1 hypothetical protein PPERSA_01530 [Pseudocohnilembus persalinus]